MGLGGEVVKRLKGSLALVLVGLGCLAVLGHGPRALGPRVIPRLRLALTLTEAERVERYFGRHMPFVQRLRDRIDADTVLLGSAKGVGEFRRLVEFRVYLFPPVLIGIPPSALEPGAADRDLTGVVFLDFGLGDLGVFESEFEVFAVDAESGWRALQHVDGDEP